MSSGKWGKEPVSGKRFLTAGELAEWSKADREQGWEPACEIVESDALVNLTVEVPGYGAADLQIALLPRAIILKLKVRLLACRSWEDVWRALFGPKELFRRFDLPALIDVNRVKAELEMGVLTAIAPKQAANGQPARGVPGVERARPQVFAA
jgi:HSP20 family molecular chaperone IbpA